MPLELTLAGLEIQDVDEIVDELSSDLRDAINPGLDLSTSQPMGQVVKIFSAKLREHQEVMLAVYSAMDPDAAEGASLVRVCDITGTERDEAKKSQLVAVTVNINDGFSAAAGAMVAHVNGDPSRRFVNKDPVANSSVVTADVSADFEAETAGPVACFAAQLTVIAEPLTGWNSVTNPTDAKIGAEEQPDSALRLKRRDELFGGTHYVDAIRTDVLQNEALEVRFCKVLENDTDAIDLDGHPIKSIEVIAYGPPSPGTADNDALAAQILKSKPAGIQAYGSTTRSVTDDQGNTHQIGLTRPTDKPVYLEVDLDTDADYPEDGDAQVAEAMVAVGDDKYQPGDDVIAERLKAACFSVPGVTDVTALRLGFSASPVGTSNLSIALREIATLDTSRVLVAS